MSATRAQLEILRLHRDTCIENGIGPLLYKSRSPEGTVTVNTGGEGNAQYNTTFVQATQYRTDDSEPTSDTYVWATWTPQELRVGANDAGDSVAMGAWMQRMKGQMAALDVDGNPVTMQDQDWMVAPDGTRLQVINPVISPDNAMWTFEAISQK